MSTVYNENEKSKGHAFRTYGIPDGAFERGDVPMTKSEIRAITLSKLGLSPGDCAVDIGAGTGSVSIEMAMAAADGRVYAIESNPEGIELIKANALKFGVPNIDCIHGAAPEALSGIEQVDAVFIGGTGGALEAIMDWTQGHLKSGGRLVANFITLENLSAMLNRIKSDSYDQQEVIEVGVSRGRFVGSLTMMTAQNPVYILSARKR